MDRSSSLTCHIPDGQMGRIIESLILPKSWIELVLAQIQLADELKRVERERKRVEERTSLSQKSNAATIRVYGSTNVTCYAFSLSNLELIYRRPTHFV